MPSVFLINLVISTACTTQPPKVINTLNSNIISDECIERGIQVNSIINSQISSIIMNRGIYHWDKDVINLNIEITRNLDKLNQISNLSLEGSQGVVTFSNDFIKSIANILMDLKHQPEIFPTFSGNVQLEYEDSEKYLEIEINPELKMSLFKIDKNGNEDKSTGINLDVNKINEELDWFYG